jgi:hypothetical protein
MQGGPRGSEVFPVSAEDPHPPTVYGQFAWRFLADVEHISSRGSIPYLDLHLNATLYHKDKMTETEVLELGKAGKQCMGLAEQS